VALEKPRGEIDIVARRRKLPVFVEVKARATLYAAAEAVSERQRSRIAAAAEAWPATFPQANVPDLGFDAVPVAPGKLPRHIQAAFESA
jgi:putative endonuclease